MTFDTTGTRDALADVHLGDIITVGAGQSYTVRAVARQLAVVVGNMSGFVLVGELGPHCLLLSVPERGLSQVTLYTPLDNIPPRAASAQPRCQGAVSYFAPHLPNARAAMGELGYKVAEIRGSFDPLVLLWRGAERVVFAPSTTLPVDALRITALPRDGRVDEAGERHAAVVEHLSNIAYAPEEAVRSLKEVDETAAVGGRRRWFR